MKTAAKAMVVGLMTVLMCTSCVRLHTYSDEYTGQLPGFDDSYQLADDQYYPRLLTSMAVKIFYTEWKKKFKDEDGKVLKAINNIRIIWVNRPMYLTKKCKKIEINGTINKQDLVFLRVRKTDKSIGATSLSHELVHLANHTMRGEYDYDHAKHVEGEKIGWTEEHDKFISMVNAKIRKAEAAYNKKRKALTAK